MIDEESKCREHLELLEKENELLRESCIKFNLLNELFSDMLKLPDLESIYRNVLSCLQKHVPNTILLFNVIDELHNESTLVEVAGLTNSLLQRLVKVAGFNPIGKVYRLVPEHNDYCRTGKLVEYKDGLAQFSASELTPAVATIIEKLIGLRQIHTIGILTEKKLLATIHFFTFGKNHPIDRDFIEVLVNHAAIVIQEKLAERELKESEIRFKALHNATFGGIAIHKDGIILDCNQGLSEMTGYKMDVLNGMHVLQLIAESSRTFLEERLQNSDNKPYESVGLRADGTEFQLRLEGRNVPYKGKMVRTLELRDITEQKRNEIELLKAKERAEESDRLKSAFLTNMSHEIRTPMNGILGFASLLKNPKLTPSEAQEYFNIIEKSGMRMLNIINDLITISKLESGLMDLIFTSTNINAQMGFMLNLFKAEAYQKGIRLSLNNSLPSRETTITTDREKFNSVLANLLRNALKFTQKGTVEFGYQEKGDKLEFYVTDTGIGIPEEKQKAIFERFIQVDSSLSRGYEGAGLGLSISKAYIELLGGEMWVKSELGKGTSFFFNLPYRKHLMTSTTPVDLTFSENGSKYHNKTVLIVEDDDDSLMYLSIFLRNTGCKIFKAGTGVQAVELCHHHPEISLVLMDIKMPQMNGYLAAKLIKEFRPNLPIIAQSAYYLDMGKYGEIFSSFLPKPVSPEELKQRIDECLYSEIY